MLFTHGTAAFLALALISGSSAQAFHLDSRQLGVPITASGIDAFTWLPSTTRCSIDTGSLFVLPPTPGAALSIPTGTAAFLTLGRGIQNYTCTEAGTWKSSGAIASLFDISCFPASSVGQSIVQSAHDTPFDPTTFYAPNNFEGGLENSAVWLGQHTFVLDEATSVIEPMFDFTLVLNSTTEFIVGNKTASTPSPDDPVNNVAWLQLANLSGGLATSVYRLQTVGGMPPPSCGSPSTAATLQVPYAALYWFFQ